MYSMHMLTTTVPVIMPNALMPVKQGNLQPHSVMLAPPRGVSAPLLSALLYPPPPAVPRQA